MRRTIRATRRVYLWISTRVRVLLPWSSGAWRRVRPGGWGAWPGCGLVGCEPHGPIPAEAATSTPGLAALSTQTRGHRVTEGLGAWITRVGDGETPATRP